MIIDHLMLSMKSSRVALRAAVTALAVACKGTSVISHRRTALSPCARLVVLTVANRPAGTSAKAGPAGRILPIHHSIAVEPNPTIIRRSSNYPIHGRL
jgi:hypothetical protein